MGGSGGMFGSSKQKASGAFKMTKDATLGEAEALSRQRAIASGLAPSIAQMSFNQNIDQSNQQAMAMAASQRGVSNPALAFRQAQMGNQQNNLQASQQGAIMAEQERRMADDFIARQAAAQRGIALQSAMANQQADTQKSGAQTGMVSSLGGAMVAASAGKPPPDQKAPAQSPSDRDVKENIKPLKNASGEMEKFLSSLKPSQYEYKDSANGTGEKIGVMAQDLEKSKIGKTMVDQAPDGTKMVDTNKAIGALLAGMADLNKKIKKLEK